MPKNRVSLNRFMLEMDVTTNVDKLQFNLTSMFQNLINGTLVKPAAEQIGNKIKDYTLKRRNWKAKYNLNQSGGFLRALNTEKPKFFKFDRNSWGVGFGDISKLNKITRPRQIVDAEFKTPEGSIKRKYVLKKGTFPIWILAEFGSRGRKDSTGIPGMFMGDFQGDSDPSKTALSRPLGIPNGHNKKIHIMYNPDNRHKKALPKRAKERNRPHPGTYPTKPFRSGLRRAETGIRRIIKNMIKLTFKGLGDRY